MIFSFIFRNSQDWQGEARWEASLPGPGGQQGQQPQRSALQRLPSWPPETHPQELRAETHQPVAGCGAPSGQPSSRNRPQRTLRHPTVSLEDTFKRLVLEELVPAHPPSDTSSGL